MTSRPNVPALRPSARSTPGRPLPSTGSLQVRFPGFLGTAGRLRPPLPRGQASRFPSRPASSPSLGRTTACAPLRSPRDERTPRGPGPFCAAPAPRLRRWRRRDLPGLGDPCTHAPLPDPGGAPAPGPFGTGVGVFRSTDGVDPARIYFRGSITRPARSLCTLRSRGHPRTTQHSVPAGGQPWPGRTLTCRVASKVSAMSLLLHAFPLHQTSPGATVAENAGPYARSLRKTRGFPAETGCGSSSPPVSPHYSQRIERRGVACSRSVVRSWC